MAKAKPQETNRIEVTELVFGHIELQFIGTSPLLCNTMSQKVKQGLLNPKGRKSAAEKAANIKHNPPDEFRDSASKWIDDSHPTRIKHPSVSFKKAAMSAALRIPGVTKTELGQLLVPQWEDVDIYGIPQLKMDVVRSADMKRTPDVRTRAVLPYWACSVRMKYLMPNLSDGPIVRLFAAAGALSGIGDGRQEKGTHSFGQFSLVTDAEIEMFKQIQATGGRAEQDRAFDACTPYDEESRSLLDGWRGEMENLGTKGFKHMNKRAA